jgi:hypothetical protein
MLRESTLDMKWVAEAKVAREYEGILAEDYRRFIVRSKGE